MPTALLLVIVVPSKLAIQVYSPACDVLTALSVRVLVTTCPLAEGSDGVGVSLGPIHWNTGLPLTVPGRVTKHMRETNPPATTKGVEGEMVIISGSARKQYKETLHTIMHSVFQQHYIGIVLGQPLEY